jgi:CO/xanthine dehydrogenase Mo-binding subunit
MFMRAPGEATGSIALESAIDQMAEACGMDPLAFRLKNYAEFEPISGKPFSSKALRECYRQGAERFGWERRPLGPRTMRDRDGLLVGWGVGTATFPALMFAGNAKALLRRDGGGVMEIRSSWSGNRRATRPFSAPGVFTAIARSILMQADRRHAFSDDQMRSQVHNLSLCESPEGVAPRRRNKPDATEFV